MVRGLVSSTLALSSRISYETLGSRRGNSSSNCTVHVQALCFRACVGAAKILKQDEQDVCVYPVRPKRRHDGVRNMASRLFAESYCPGPGVCSER